MSGAKYASFALNVCSAVAIVFVNQILMQKHDFHFASCLTTMHVIAGAIFILSYKGPYEKESMGIRELAFFVFCSCASIVSLNLSLLVNSVTFYQIAKLLIVPCTAMLEWYMMGSSMSKLSILCTVVTVLGVGIVTINDFKLNLTLKGLLIALLSVVTSCLQQVLVRKLQHDYKLTSMELLAIVSPVSSVLLLAVAPFVDKAVSGDWVTTYIWSMGAASVLILSCSLAIVVNISQFLCLGKFSAVSFQVMGHLKTISIFLISWLYLNEQYPAIKLFGVLVTSLGIISYSIVTLREKSQGSGKAV